MAGRIQGEERIQSRKKADTPRNEIAIPSCMILKVGKDKLGVVLVRATSKQHTDKNKVACDVDNKN